MSETPVFSKTKSLNHQNHQPAIILINTLTGYIINLYIYIISLYNQQDCRYIRQNHFDFVGGKPAKRGIVLDPPWPIRLG